ncbi:drug/metabolite transporter (DMT)-like permease [Actinoplanes lutulentus]|uniref:Drug/metabolite transporter (DMT)-like permease n=2 Tax=Actinoplanes lutulentus TaxID=1287878 RepID=A0A327Z0F0_9ACTN|nr:DMT family transporter [Actinoplanes lutulentus]RAK27621.1 drug/metabolite transporter (DMT)-like permease [Actinoplanes lutulentus]
MRRWFPAYLALAAIWGTSFLFIKVGVRELHPLWLTFGRVAAGALVLVVALAITRDRLPRDWRLWGHLQVVALLGVVVPFTLFGFGEQRVSSVLAGIWNAATPLVALPLAALVFRTERLTARKVAGIGIGFAGVLVVLGVWQGVGGSQFTGQLMCFAAAMCYAVAIPYQKKFIAGRAGSGVSMAGAQLLSALAQLAIVAPLFAGAPPNPLDLSTDVILCVLALGALGTGLAFVLNFHVIRVAGVSTSSSVTYLMPVVATVVGVLILREHLHWNQPVGALIVLIGVAVTQDLVRRLSRKPAATADADPYR